ncbi:MAG: LPS export ABC transporter periplasmic protein LptC [Desulfobacterota bacterium]|nr:LPS export ABC transporter periplasmic protein LptC [Thermodesulfobacteriota bacterium]
MIITAIGIIATVVIIAILTERRQLIIKSDHKSQMHQTAAVSLKEVAYSTVNKENFKEWDLQARTAQYYKNEKRVVLEDVVVNLYRPDGSVYHLRGEKGEYNTETKDIAMSGSIYGNLPDNTTVQAESFYYDNAHRIIKTDSLVRIQRNGLRLEGVGMIVELDKEKLTLLGKVKASGNK